jgi:hypothetical protein
VKRVLYVPGYEEREESECRLCPLRVLFYLTREEVEEDTSQHVTCDNSLSVHDPNFDAVGFSIEYL